MNIVQRQVSALMMVIGALGGLTGCAMDHYWLPEKYATVQEAFPSLAPPAEAEMADQAVSQQVFNASYEDVFQAVRVAL